MARPINKKNPNNSASPLFKQLTKIFSGPLVNYRRQDTRRLKRRKLDKYRSRFRSASGQEFKTSIYSDVYNALNYDYYSNQNRLDRYVDFDQMEYTPEIASSLDIYADEMTTFSVYRPILNIICTNEEIKTTIETLLYNIMNIEYNLYGWCRSMCKYGDYFLYLDIEEDDGIKNVIGLPSNELERLEGEDKNNPNFIQYQWNTAGLTLENWQVGHFRLLGNDKFAPYGTSVLEPARRIWRQLTLLEDAMMAYRIVRSPDRRAFYVDVGNIPPEDVEQYMQRVMTQMKRNQVVDVNTGRVDLRYNPLSIEEDYFVPVRGGQSGTKIESIAGGKYTGDIDDVKYLRDKLFSALKIPQAYLTQPEGAVDDKAALAQKDIRFARTIQRLQRSIITELTKIVTIHLFTLGYRGNDLLSFKLALNNPSKLAELQELEHWKSRFESADAASAGYFSRRWVARNILNLSEEEFQRMQTEMYYDKKQDTMLEQVAEAMASAAAPPADAAGGGGMPGMPDMGDDMGGDMGLEGGAEGGEEEPGVEEAGPLLATPGEEPPAKRDDGTNFKTFKTDKYGRVLTTTDSSKGKWYKKDPGPDRRNGLAQSQKAWSGMQNVGKTKRSFLQGAKELGINYSLSESTNPNYYDEEEKQILKNSADISKLIESLEKAADETKP
jgi:hypothetical protein